MGEGGEGAGGSEDWAGGRPQGHCGAWAEGRPPLGEGLPAVRVGARVWVMRERGLGARTSGGDGWRKRRCGGHSQPHVLLLGIVCLVEDCVRLEHAGIAMWYAVQRVRACGLLRMPRVGGG
jgi:hypothetical protein